MHIEDAYLEPPGADDADDFYLWCLAGGAVIGDVVRVRETAKVRDGLLMPSTAENPVFGRLTRIEQVETEASDVRRLCVTARCRGALSRGSSMK